MNVPEGWAQTTLGAEVTIHNGVAPGKVERTPQGFPYLKVEDLNFSPKYIMTSREYTDDTRWVVPAESVIFPKRGAAIMNNKVRLAGTDVVLDTNLMALRGKDNVNAEYLFYAVLHEGLSKIADTSTIPQINNKHISPYRLALPPYPEQRKIAEVLRTWDDAIDHTTGLRNKLSQRFSAVRERLLSPANSRPRLLSETTRELSARNYGEALSRDLVMGVSNRAGLVPMREHTIANDISRYRVLSHKGFAYNPMRINVGSIAMSEFTHDVLVSPDYVLFECDASALSPRYFNHVIRTRKWRHYVNAGAAGSVRTRTYYDDLARISIHTPTLAEQIRVTAALDLAKAEVDAVDRQLALLRKQKHGLMQKLLTGEIRVNVEDPT